MNLAPTAVSYPWFALQTRCRYESFVAKQLAHKGYEILLPLYECRRRWSDRIKELELPLFPGYVFCRFNPLVRLPILMTPGVIQVVGVGKSPVDRKSTRLNSSHVRISYAVFCLKKKKNSTNAH